MANEQTEGPDGPGARRGARLARREEQRRRIRRRRLIASGVAMAAVVAAIAVVALSNGDSGSDSVKPSRTASSGGGGKAHAPVQESAGLVRNATPQPGWVTHTGPVPILEYHVLGAAPADVPYPELYVSRPDFRRQLGWLDRRGFQAVTLEQVEKAWYHGGTLPAKPVVLSFDDGYRPQFTFALPQLRLHGWAGVLNLKAEGSDLYTSK